MVELNFDYWLLLREKIANIVMMRLSIAFLSKVVITFISSFAHLVS